MTNNIAPPPHDAFVAIGAERISDGKTQTAESLADAQHRLVDHRIVLVEALTLALSVANDCQQRWSRGHPARVEAASMTLDAVRTAMREEKGAAPIEKALAPLLGRPRATEIEWLRFFAQNADFGPADGDVHLSLQREFMDRTGKNLPEGWNFGPDGETKLDRP